MSIENPTLAHFRHFSSLFTYLPAYKAADIYVPIRHYICREPSTNQLLFMQNKPNFQDPQMNVSIYLQTAYENKSNWTLGENKANSNPIKPNFRKAQMNVNSLITKDYRKKDDFVVRKNKPNSNPISEKPKMNVNVYVIEDYENETALRPKKTNPIKPNSCGFLLEFIPHTMRERFAKFGLELHPDKTRVIAFNKRAANRVKGNKHSVRTFDFLGFTHYWGKSRRGNWTLCRKTSAKGFRKSCKEMNEWLRQVRCAAKLREWWPILQAKLRGYYQYYGISGNRRAIERYHYVAKRLIFKWLNRRSQKASFDWGGFNAYLEHYPLPEPRIVHHLYTLSFVS